MAKKSKIAKNEQRKEVYLRYRDKVAQLKKDGRYDELQKLPRNASRTRIRNRDSIDGRPRGYISKFGISRVKFREMANRGELPGVKNQAGKKEEAKMVMTDPIADMLTRIRNANKMRHEKVEIPLSKMKEEIAKILVKEGFIVSYEVIPNEVQGTLVVTLKYTSSRERVIKGLKGYRNQDFEFMLKSKNFHEF